MSANFSTPDEYATVHGTEPDKWASAWLIHRRLDPVSHVTVYSDDPDPSSVQNAIWFDVADPQYNATFKRTRSALTYQHIIKAHDITDSTLVELGRLFYEIEQFSWSTNFSAEKETLELSFRGLQQYFYPSRVPEACYYEYFDKAYEALRSDVISELHNWVNGLAGGWNLCGQLESKTMDLAVPSVSLAELTPMLTDNRDVIFIDTREQREYIEKHIPNAVNMPLRELADQDLSALRHADLVVPYCVKDFRAYEVARRLRELGLTNVAMMTPHGLNGWIKHGLPINGSKTKSSEPGLSLSLSERICRSTNYCDG